MDVIMIILLGIILNIGHCAANKPFSSDETFLPDQNCPTGATMNSEFWTWARQQSDLFAKFEKSIIFKIFRINF